MNPIVGLVIVGVFTAWSLMVRGTTAPFVWVGVALLVLAALARYGRRHSPPDTPATTQESR